MDHQFNVTVATQFGIEVAVFLNNLAFWTDKNLSNKEHYQDGRIWVYNTQEAWTLLFPYFSRQNIRTIVTKSLTAELITKGNYNKLNYDRTTWYSLTDKALEFYPYVRDKIQKLFKSVDNSKSLGWNQPMERLESTNTLVGINQPIPDNKPDNKQQIKSFCVSQEQKKHKTVNNSTDGVKTAPPVKKSDWKEANQKKHSWADGKKEAPRADVTKQSTSYDPDKHRTTATFDPNSPGYQAFVNSVPSIRRAHQKRKEAIEAAKLPAGTSVQSEIPSRSEPDSQGATIDDGGQRDNPPPIRSANRLLEARRVHSFLEETGLAS